jgi:hypothetical protein
MPKSIRTGLLYACRSALAGIAVVVTTLAAPAALGATLITLEDECRGRQLLVRGPIEPGDFERIRARLNELVSTEALPEVQDPETLWTVKLDSPGGDVAEAMRIGRLLRTALATTDVSYRFARRDDGVYDFQRTAASVCLEGEHRLDGCASDVVKAECAGACLLIWLAGADRFAQEGQLGLAALPGVDATAVAEYLREMEVADGWRARLVEEQPADPVWLSWPERRALSGRARSLDTLLAHCPAALDAEEAFEAVTAESPVVRDALMDRAEAHRRCRIERIGEARAPVLESLLRAGVRAAAL